MPKSPRFYQRAEGLPWHTAPQRDPSLRLKSGYAQDDAIDERRCHQKFKVRHHRESHHLNLSMRRSYTYTPL